MILPIVKEGDPVLRKRARKIGPDYPIGTLVLDMVMTMIANKGIGLAASQVGLPIRLFVINTRNLKRNGIVEAFGNAHIVDHSPFKSTGKEGCLSIPGVEVYVPRWESITLKYQSFHIEPDSQKIITKEFSGIEARVIQHELDHTMGKLITDYDTTLHSKKTPM